ncbi:monooxygenase [Parafrankia colletiae]|uniref:Monooxygenase n=1 Tax=Parafrankia colletiae TaxID=573497 RepID=A0A1S1QBI6_9ACTN|nr:LLM class flavin-dependent oxidoreductase [Parafrankia colletiae]MCK9903095.1 LLM class flavin-dependent oxidoreductase [Frankia sp. Cpl3]OHV30959.1 monooxygenase [Parafrankia colletiae]
MTEQPRQLHLNLFGVGTGRHEAAWRHPDADPIGALGIETLQRNAQIAERGKFDAVFVADSPWIGPMSPHGVRATLDPIVTMTALAGVTSRIGLIATLSTTYSEPYTVARALASLDQVSGGRSGWNVVTTSEAAVAANFGDAPFPSHEERYARGEEFVDVVLALWDSWEHGAIVADKANGIHADLDKIRPIDFVGKYFTVRGPLNVVRSPQEKPLIVQAGSSPVGRAFGAKYADAIFTAQPLLDGAQQAYADIKAHAAAFGRDPDAVKVLPGLCPVIGDTEQAAQDLLDELNELVIPAFGIASLHTMTGIDLSGVPLDEPLPDRLGDSEGFQGLTSRLKVVLSLAEGRQLTARQLLNTFAAGFGHKMVVGTPEQVADEMQFLFENRAADGFNVMPPVVPRGLEDFVDQVVPLLQRRGIFRRDYTGRTLRSHYDAELG